MRTWLWHVELCMTEGCAALHGVKEPGNRVTLRWTQPEGPHQHTNPDRNRVTQPRLVTYDLPQQEDIEEEDERVGDLRSPELALNGEDGDEDVTPEDKEYMGQDLLDKADYEPEDWDIHSHTHIHPDVKQGPAIGRKGRLGNAPALLDSEKLLISKASASMIRDSDRSSGHSGSGILGSASELVRFLLRA